METYTNGNPEVTSASDNLEKNLLECSFTKREKTYFEGNRSSHVLINDQVLIRLCKGPTKW